MRKEKRKNATRHRHAHATIDYANVEREKATLVDLAQDGMSVQFGQKLPPTSKVYFSIPVAGTILQRSPIGSSRVAGLERPGGSAVCRCPKTSRRLLTDFLGANLTSESKQEYLPDVTVEMEELPSPGYDFGWR